MEKVLMSTLMALSKSVEATTISPAGKHTVAWCLGKLPRLYAQYHATNESRFGDEIRRLVQALIKELTDPPVECQAAFALGATVNGRFVALHERLSLPALMLKTPTLAAPARPRKRTAPSGDRR